MNSDWLVFGHYRLISFKPANRVEIAIQKIRKYTLVPVWMTLTFIYGRSIVTAADFIILVLLVLPEFYF